MTCMLKGAQRCSVFCLGFSARPWSCRMSRTGRPVIEAVECFDHRNVSSTQGCYPSCWRNTSTSIWGFDQTRDLTSSRGKKAHGTLQVFARKKSSTDDIGQDISVNHLKTVPHDGEFTCSIEVKKSRFVAFAWHVESEEEAMMFIGKVRDPSASHTCWAIRIGQKVCRCSDDGEPSGTAGKPILNAIESMNLDEVCVAVTRYYGGTKLGTGGLCRAYSGAARELLQQIPLDEIIPMRNVSITVPTELLGIAFHVLESHGGKNVVETFDESHGDRFVVTFDVEETSYKAVESHLRESSRGKINVHEQC